MILRHIGSRDGLISIATGYELDGWDLNPGKGKIFFSTQPPDWLWRASYPKDMGAVSPLGHDLTTHL
jgi:hypothetical protein